MKTIFVLIILSVFCGSNGFAFDLNSIKKAIISDGASIIGSVSKGIKGNKSMTVEQPQENSKKLVTRSLETDAIAKVPVSNTTHIQLFGITLKDQDRKSFKTKMIKKGAKFKVPQKPDFSEGQARLASEEDRDRQMMSFYFGSVCDEYNIDDITKREYTEAVACFFNDGIISFVEVSNVGSREVVKKTLDEKYGPHTILVKKLYMNDRYVETYWHPVDDELIRIESDSRVTIKYFPHVSRIPDGINEQNARISRWEEIKLEKKANLLKEETRKMESTL